MPLTVVEQKACSFKACNNTTVFIWYVSNLCVKSRPCNYSKQSRAVLISFYFLYTIYSTPFSRDKVPGYYAFHNMSPQLIIHLTHLFDVHIIMGHLIESTESFKPDTFWLSGVNIIIIVRWEWEIVCLPLAYCSPFSQLNSLNWRLANGCQARHARNWYASFLGGVRSKGMFCNGEQSGAIVCPVCIE